MNFHPTPEMPDVCLSFVLLFTIFIIVVTQKLVLQQSKNVTEKCTETLSPPPSIQFSLGHIMILFYHCVFLFTIRISTLYSVYIVNICVLSFEILFKIFISSSYVWLKRVLVCYCFVFYWFNFVLGSKLWQNVRKFV